MATRIRDLWRWCMHRMPEALLLFFLAALAPMLVMAASELAGQVAVVWRGPRAYYEATAHNPLPLIYTVVCLLGGALLTYVLARHWVIIWAVARKLIIEAIHRKVVLVLLVFFAGLMFSLPFVLKTEGSLKSQVQLLMLYSLALGMMLMSLLAIFVSAASICSEIETKRVQVTDTKPLARWQFLLGKWFGVVVMCAGILAVMTASAAAIVWGYAREPDVSRMLPAEAAKARNDYEQVLDELLVARRSVAAREPLGVDEATDERYEEIRKKGDLPKNIHQREQFRSKLRTAFLAQMLTVPPGGVMIFEFEGLQPGAASSKLFIRFTADCLTREGVLTGQFVALRRTIEQNKAGERVTKFARLSRAPAPPGGWMAFARAEVQLPASAIEEDGSLFVAYENINTPAPVRFDAKKPVEVLQEIGGFWSNYYRTFLVLLCHIALLAALGLAAGAVFSFPVASLAVVFIFIVGLVGTWFVTFMEPPSIVVQFSFWTDVALSSWRAFLKAVMIVMPHFGKYNPLGDLTDGQLVRWSFVSSAAAVMVFIKGGFVTLIGMYLYSRRELARVIV